MCNPKFKKGSYKKRFFRPSNPLIRMACTLTKDLVGTNEEKLGQFEMVVQTKEFKEKYPGLMGKDVASIVRLQLVGKCGLNFVELISLRRIVAESFSKIA